MNQITEIPIGDIAISSQNTRKDLKQGTEDASLEDLASSIREHGLLNPITVRPRPEGGYEVVAGQRRVLALRLLGQAKVPAVIRTTLADQQAVAVSLIENMQRADMAPIDKARGLTTLVEQYGSTTEVAKQTGLSPQTIRRYTSLLRLPQEVQSVFSTSDGPASIGVASTIASSFADQEEMKNAWDQVKDFKSETAKRIIQQSGGDIERVRENTLLAAEGAFDLHRCGSNLASCPHVPPRARAAILRLAQDASDF